MEINKAEIESVLRNFDNLGVPFYQRDYVWGEKEITKLLMDVSKNKDKGYYLGTLIFKTEPYTNRKNIIDGQQRLTTIWLIKRCIYDIIIKNNDFFKEKSEFYNHIQEILKEIERKIHYFEFYSTTYEKGEHFKNIIKYGFEDDYF